MRPAVPQKLRSGKAARNFSAKARTSWRPRQGACSEYSKRISGAASSSMTAGLKSLPQNSVNQRPTMALFSSIDMDRPFLVAVDRRLPFRSAHTEDGRQRGDVRSQGGILPAAGPGRLPARALTGPAQALASGAAESVA